MEEFSGTPTAKGTLETRVVNLERGQPVIATNLTALGETVTYTKEVFSKNFERLFQYLDANQDAQNGKRTRFDNG